MRLGLPCIMRLELYPFRKLPTHFSEEANFFSGYNGQATGRQTANEYHADGMTVIWIEG